MRDACSKCITPERLEINENCLQNKDRISESIGEVTSVLQCPLAAKSVICLITLSGCSPDQYYNLEYMTYMSELAHCCTLERIKTLKH
jgi:hypothetical protein